MDIWPGLALLSPPSGYAKVKIIRRCLEGKSAGPSRRGSATAGSLANGLGKLPGQFGRTRRPVQEVGGPLGMGGGGEDRAAVCL